MFKNIIALLIIFKILMASRSHNNRERKSKSMEDMIHDYADDRNAMATVTEQEPEFAYDDFYDEFDHRETKSKSMNMIFFGPDSSFMRLDAETILYLLVNTQKHMIPVSRITLAWDLLTDGKTAAFLQGREFMAFGPLLNYVPEEDLFFVNFGDPTVLSFFATHDVKLRSRKFGILASAYKRFFGEEWYLNGTHINELGYIICGFPSSYLARIPPSVIVNINAELFGKLKRCSEKHAQVLFDIVVNPAAYDIPYTWSSHEVTRLGYLFTYIKAQDISSVQLEAVRSITPSVINAMHRSKLPFFTKQQVFQMNPKTRKTYIMRIQAPTSSGWEDIQEKAKADILSPSILFIALIILYVSVFFKYQLM